jgi:hypothetical protein
METRRVTTNATRPDNRVLTVWWRSLAGLAALAFLALLLTTGSRALGDLEAMQADLHHLNGQLATLDDMNRKLDRLATVSTGLSALRGELEGTRSQLRETNRLLVHANAKLDGTSASVASMSGSLRIMERDLGSLNAMRSDIHTMVHKIGGSFLFRGVK